jgi:chromosome segregation ATPase
MTEGNPVLILINEHEGYTVVVDSTLNVATVVLSKAIANYSKRILSRANSDDDGFISAMNEAKSSILELKNKIIAVASEWISKQKENIDNLKKNLENLESKQIDVLAESAGTKMQMDDIEQQLRTLKAKQKNGKLGSRLKEQIKQLEHKRAKLLDKYDKLQSESKRLSKQIGKIKPKLTALGHGLAKLYELYQIVNGFIKTVNNIGKALADRSRWMALINKIEPCKGDEKNAALLKQNCKSDWTNIAWKKGYYPSVGITGVVTAINVVLFVRKDIKFIAGFVI